MQNQQLYRLAQAIKEKRRSLNMGLEELASHAQVSKSLISKIENYRTIPSLPVIMRIAEGLKTSLSDLTAGIDNDSDYTYLVVPGSERQRLEKEEATGFFYQSLFMKNVNELLFEAAILTLEKDARRSLVTTDGNQFIFVLRGAIEFVIGPESVFLKEGDSLLFNGRLPHVPKNAGEVPAEFLVIYLIEQSRER